MSSNGENSPSNNDKDEVNVNQKSPLSVIDPEPNNEHESVSLESINESTEKTSESRGGKLESILRKQLQQAPSDSPCLNQPDKRFGNTERERNLQDKTVPQEETNVDPSLRTYTENEGSSIGETNLSPEKVINTVNEKQGSNFKLGSVGNSLTLPRMDDVDFKDHIMNRFKQELSPSPPYSYHTTQGLTTIKEKQVKELLLSSTMDRQNTTENSGFENTAAGSSLGQQERKMIKSEFDYKNVLPQAGFNPETGHTEMFSPMHGPSGYPEDGSRPKKVRHKKRVNGQKICLVCGDKALAHNFDVITCESCKAFFRRNALKSQVSCIECLYRSSSVAEPFVEGLRISCT